MSTSEIILYILWGVLGLIVGTNGIFNLIKWFKEKKYDNEGFKVRCNLLADLLAAGVKVPTDLIIKVLRNEITTPNLAKELRAITDKIKHKGDK